MIISFEAKWRAKTNNILFLYFSDANTLSDEAYNYILFKYSHAAEIIWPNGRKYRIIPII